MAVNELSPRAKPEDKVCLRCHKSMATRAVTVICTMVVNSDQSDCCIYRRLIIPGIAFYYGNNFIDLPLRLFGIFHNAMAMCTITLTH